MSEQFSNIGSAILNMGSTLSSIATSLTVTSQVNVPSSGTFRALIQNELIKVTAVSGTTWTVVRGDGGTTATTHADGAILYIVVTKEALDALVSIQSSGSETSNRRVLNFVGASVADNSGSSRCDITTPTNLTGTTSSLPAASVNGNLYFPSDGMSLYRDNGSSWDSFGPIFKLTAPVLANYTWVNQGTATVTQTGIGLYVTDPSGSADNIRMLVINAPSTPYTLVVGILANWNLGYAGYMMCGPCFYESSTNKIVTSGLMHNKSVSNTTVTSLDKYNSTTSFSAQYTRDGMSREPFWWSLKNDGTNLIYGSSVDGVNFITQLSTTLTNFFTTGPNKIGLYLNPGGGFGATLLSWKVA